MLRILGSRRRLCQGLTRRDFLHAGGLFGLSLCALAGAAARSAASPAGRSSSFGRAKACILLCPYGSPAQHETFDPKPDAPAGIRGELGAISTSIPGVQICDRLPLVARIMDRVTVVRSMTHPFPVHGVAYALTGIPNYDPSLERNPRDPRHWPFIGSCVDYVLEQASDGAPPEVPRNVQLPWLMNSQNGELATAGPFAAFLGPAFDPVVAKFEGKATHATKKSRPGEKVHEVWDPFCGMQPDGRFRIDGTALAEDMTLDRLNSRRSLLAQFDDARARLARQVESSSFDRYRDMSYTLITGSKLREALDIRREAMANRELYGMTLFGQGCLAARRLIEAGGKFVTVFWDEVGPYNTDWDTHWNHFPRLKERLLPGFDRAFSGLITDLDQRGLLDETVVMWMSEHGRSPKINGSAGGGRDHWSRAYSIALAGGGIARGSIVGASDKHGGDVLHTPVSPKDILATIYYLLGIDPELTVPDRLGRPTRIAGEGHVRAELF